MALRTPRIQLGKASLGPQCLPTGSLAARTFTTTAAARTNGQAPPPDSPAYIPMPEDPFEDETKPERVRGSLPVPRQVFTHPRDKHKLEPRYMDETYPRSPKETPATELAPGSQKEWKRILSEARRQNLKLGLSGLWDRHVKTESGDKLAKQRRHENYLAAGSKPPPPHDRHSGSSILRATLRTRVEPDPQRFEKAEESRRLTESIAEEKRLVRRNAIMELYLNAEDFITDERDLAAEVEYAFSDKFWKRPGPQNAWAQYGKRPDLESMLSDVVRYGRPEDMGFKTEDFNRNVRRQKTVAEELTGGKLDTSSSEDGPRP